MTTQTLTAGRNEISFKSLGNKLVAHLYTPEGFDEGGSYPAIVFSPPFNQVKEQTGAVYGRKLAALGYVTLAFDHIGYGDSEGEIRNNENSFVKIESIRDAISFMGTLPFVDRAHLFGLGVCASGGYMALVATTDKRLKAIASVAGMLGNQASYFDAMDRETATAVITAQNAARQKYYETGEIEYVDALELEAASDLPGDDPMTLAMKEGYDFYMTERAGAQTYPNYSHLAPGFMLEAPMLADATSYAPYLYMPAIIITGTEAATKPLSEAFFQKASEPKEYLAIEGSTHIQLYDIDEYVDQAVAAIDGFFQKHGGTTAEAA